MQWIACFGIPLDMSSNRSCFVTELVNIIPLTVLGDFIASNGHNSNNNSQVSYLQYQVHKLSSVPHYKHGARPVAVLTKLNGAKFALICRDAQVTPLQYPYKALFRSLEQSKNFLN